MKDCIDCYNLRKAAKKNSIYTDEIKVHFFLTHLQILLLLIGLPLPQFPPQDDFSNHGGFHAAGAVFRVPFDNTRIVPASVFAACDFRAAAELAAAPMPA